MLVELWNCRELQRGELTDLLPVVAVVPTDRQLDSENGIELVPELLLECARQLNSQTGRTRTKAKRRLSQFVRVSNVFCH